MSIGLKAFVFSGLRVEWPLVAAWRPDAGGEFSAGVTVVRHLCDSCRCQTSSIPARTIIQLT